jgi:RsiW-degrading membrane proteinase PrsW (M82 family)
VRLLPRIPASDWRRFAFAASRSRRWLAFTAIVMLLLGAGIGAIASCWNPPAPDKVIERALARAGLSIEQDEDELEKFASPTEQDAEDAAKLISALEHELSDREIEFEDVLAGIPEIAGFLPPSSHAALKTLLAKRFKPEQAELATDYVAAWNDEPAATYDRLLERADRPHPQRYLNYVLGRVEKKREQHVAAAVHFEREGRRPDAGESRYRALEECLEAEDFVGLNRLRRDPLFAPAVTPYLQLKIAAAERDWPTVLKLSPRLQFSGYETSAVVLSLLVGGAWAFFLVHLAEWPKWSGVWVLAVFGFGLGVLSTVPTLYAVVWQEDMLKLSAGDDPLHVLLYNIGGVGLREEVCKLALFLPLVPWLLRRDDELDALIVASFVGLGFAVEENTNYFLYSEATSAAGRFLTANFFHIVLTGSNGLALYRAFRWGGGGWNEFLWIFPVSVVAHGLYDGLQDIPSLDSGGYLAMAVFIACCFFYFGRAHQMRGSTQMTIGLTGAFVLGVSLVCATLLAYEMAHLGIVEGISIMIADALGCGIMVVMFVRVFREPLDA